ncbi:MAG: phosphoadenosine phosphosulfate reductase family protein [Eubacterium sp.]|nr:phosphoadenosine phosphosulfate reductase family protein [Eubacterium sp.]
MWCKNCNLEIKEKICPICGNATSEDIPASVYWCSNCKVPVIQEDNSISKGSCPKCNKKMKYMTTDIRPVFPEEKLLFEILLKYVPGSLNDSSVWATNGRYYVDGESVLFPSSLYLDADVTEIIKLLKQNYSKISYEFFEENIRDFIDINKVRLNYLVEEAHSFIKEAVKKYPPENIVVSFSGGKDSTATADIVIKALSNPEIVHIFGNTTLEFPTTTAYAKRYRENHPQAIFRIAKNNEQNFMKVCEDIGPPARMMRWCCSMFKTGPITREINRLYRNQQILTFYGIRKNESVSRSKYNRIEDDAQSVKIQQQTVASPIFFWKDLDVWLYILGENVDFNDAYRYGYDRVGCWCCPNNTLRAQFLSRIYMPEESEKWRNFLVEFAKKIGKPDPEVYVDTGMWKARQGGNGLKASGDVKLRFANCTAEEHAKIYKLVRPFNDELVNMFIPFGRLAPELGQKLLNETIVLDTRTNVPILSIQPFEHRDYEYAVKIKTMNVADEEEIQRMVGYQIRKFNACRKCLKCESICRAGAISIIGDEYYIDSEKCVHCKMCMSAKILDGGCTMDKYLRTK